MSLARATQVVLLCEDKRHEQFCRRFLSERGVSHRRIRSLVAPPGCGDAKAWVRERYPMELKAYRAKANHLTNSLVVMTDVDQETHQQRRSSLENACQLAGITDATLNERILVALPKWAIETWILNLMGEPLPEETRVQPSHKQRANPLSNQAAKRLAQACSGTRLPRGWPELPTLGDACVQFSRLAGTL